METKNNNGRIIFGALLLAAGVLTLLGQLLSPRLGDSFWPFIIIGLGLAFFLGMLLGGRSFSALAVPGSIITGIGLLLMIQNAFSLWETWSYAWALVICFVGIGLFLSGVWGQDAGLRRSGLNLVQVGFILFIIFGIIFEVLFSVSGIFTTNSLFWPVVLILVGLMMIIVRSYRLLRPEGENKHADTNLFWPVIFIGAGIMWLMVRQGMIPGRQVYAMISFWPVLLVAAGINLILGRRWQWINLLFGAAVVVGMFYVVFNANRLGLANRSPWGIMGVNFSSNGAVTEWVSGSGNVIEREEEIGSIDEVVLFGSGEMIVKQGSAPSLVIEAEDNLMQYIDVEQSGDLLTIRFKENVGISTTRPIRYTLTVPDIENIEINGAAYVSSEGLEIDNLDVSLSGFGDVQFTDLTAEDVAINVSGSGSIKMDGSVDELVVNISGAGGFNSPNLEAEDVYVNLSGIGRAVVWANQSLEPQISGIGAISYYGNPTVQKNVSGIGFVRHIGNK